MGATSEPSWLTARPCRRKRNATILNGGVAPFAIGHPREPSGSTRTTRTGQRKRSWKTWRKKRDNYIDNYRGQDAVAVGTDQPGGHVLHVAEERKTRSLASYDETLTEGQKAGLESSAMDNRWPAYIKATLEQIPEAQSQIACDKFHVATYLGGRRPGAQAGT